MLIVTDAPGPIARAIVPVLPWYSSLSPCG